MDPTAIFGKMSRKPRLALCRYLALGAECAAKETALLHSRWEASGQKGDIPQMQWPDVFDDFTFLQNLYEMGEGWEIPTSHAQAVKTIRETVLAVEKAEPEERKLLTDLLCRTRDGFRRMELEPTDWIELSEEELHIRDALLHEMGKVVEILEDKSGKARASLVEFNLEPSLCAPKRGGRSQEPVLTLEMIRKDFESMSPGEQTFIRLFAYLTVVGYEGEGREWTADLTAQQREEVDGAKTLMPFLRELCRECPEETFELEYYRSLVDGDLLAGIKRFRKHAIACHALDLHFPLKRLTEEVSPIVVHALKSGGSSVCHFMWYFLHVEKVDERELAFFFAGVHPCCNAECILMATDEMSATSLAALLYVVNEVIHTVVTQSEFNALFDALIEKYPEITKELILETIKRGDHYLDRFDRRYENRMDGFAESETLVKNLEGFPVGMRRMKKVNKLNLVPALYDLLDHFHVGWCCFLEWQSAAGARLSEVTGFPPSVLAQTRLALIHAGFRTDRFDAGLLKQIFEKEAIFQQFE